MGSAPGPDVVYSRVLVIKYRVPIDIFGNVRCMINPFTKVTLYSVEVNVKGTLKNGGLSIFLHGVHFALRYENQNIYNLILCNCTTRVANHIPTVP